jgi:hypothetical protein
VTEYARHVHAPATSNASAIAPGDTIQRSVDLTNSGSLDLAWVTLTTSASPSSLLDTDGSNGLQMVVDKSSQAWTESGPPYTYTCGGTTSSVLASRAVIGSNCRRSRTRSQGRSALRRTSKNSPGRGGWVSAWSADPALLRGSYAPSSRLVSSRPGKAGAETNYFGGSGWRRSRLFRLSRRRWWAAVPPVSARSRGASTRGNRI